MPLDQRHFGDVARRVIAVGGSKVGGDQLVRLHAHHGQRSGGEEFMRRYREMTADMEPPVRRQDITVKGVGSFSLRQSEPIPIS